MNITDRNIEVMFFAPSPEQIITNIIKKYIRHENSQGDLSALSDRVGKEFYYNSVRKISRNHNYEEIIHMYSLMEKHMAFNPELPKSIFQLLTLFSRDVLELDNGIPICHISDFPRWRRLSFKLGQDIFTTSYMAYRHTVNQLDINRFDWPAMVTCDDVRLNQILSKGISENHFHLTGSTRVFELSWICLMNHPEKIKEFFYQHDVLKELFIVNRSPMVSYDVSEYKFKWDKLIRYAVFIRAKLFQLMMGNDSIDVDAIRQFMYGFDSNTSLNREIARIRLFNGKKFLQPNGDKVCLDYTISCDVDSKSHNRALTGERELLYRCFCRCFSGNIGSFEQDLFYVYLLIKNSLRSELIQVNEETGFYNFVTYQDRKSIFWKSFPEFTVEAQKLAVNASMESGNIQSLEIRFTPEYSPLDDYMQIKSEDTYVQFSEDTNYKWSEKQNSMDLPFFYVYHFIKKKLSKPSYQDSNGYTESRNRSVHNEIKTQAVALARALEKSSYLCSRIRGIDAATFEIGCRPEIFATEFRFLRNFTPYRSDTGLCQKRISPKISASYHAGEDFLDIVDGLRAIDEAVSFLELKRGDRIGHAIALGVNPLVHYRLKNFQVIMPKQDMLDNTVWLLNRTKDFGITIPAYWESKLKYLYDELFNDIYGLSLGLSDYYIDDITYYHSWKLRGDLPECYLFSKFNNMEETKGFKHVKCPAAMQYYNYSVRHFENETLYRDRPNIISLMTQYHFGYEERIKGMEVKLIDVDETYAEIVLQIQEQMQKRIQAKGIAVECNLTSNVLIGTFKDYSVHPIFNFNNHIISSDESKHLSVSLNTDDQGVFDTSLENEYVLLCSHMAEMKKDGIRLYSDDQIYDYLNYLRKLGNSQVFPKAAAERNRSNNSAIGDYLDSIYKN